MWGITTTCAIDPTQASRQRSIMPVPFGFLNTTILEYWFRSALTPYPISSCLSSSAFSKQDLTSWRHQNTQCWMYTLISTMVNRRAYFCILTCSRPAPPFMEITYHRYRGACPLLDPVMVVSGDTTISESPMTFLWDLLQIRIPQGYGHPRNLWPDTLMESMDCLKLNLHGICVNGSCSQSNHWISCRCRWLHSQEEHPSSIHLLNILICFW